MSNALYYLNLDATIQNKSLTLKGFIHELCAAGAAV